MQVAPPAVTVDDIRGAASRLAGVAHLTPVLTSRTLDSRTGAQVFLKCENFQRMGAFKFRGAYNRLVQLSPKERPSGVLTFSSGNHAQAIALAARLLGIRATIVMPKDAPVAKIEATREYGAEIVFYDRAEEERDAIARRLSSERGAVLVPPYDDPAVIAGQGTCALELLQAVDSLDILLVPTGGGGLLAGSVVAALGTAAGLAVYGVEPEAGNDFQQSMRAGRRIKVALPDTIADGMQTQIPGELTFAIVQRYAKDIVTVSDGQLRNAMRFAFERLKLVVEPSGAASLAALLYDKVEHHRKRVGIIISGGNVDARRFAAILTTD
ncbi:MAG: threo-3-hydroxy-L-aspartate ammonia-lyase [Candidatus Eremiobacteraeota bacterium]|nr:threo-3-hydroxy-L-aspartate ammonia-lyase [Candidatus Eremiobacteraeota bacterium]